MHMSRVSQHDVRTDVGHRRLPWNLEIETATDSRCNGLRGPKQATSAPSFAYLGVKASRVRWFAAMNGTGCEDNTERTTNMTGGRM